MIVAAVPAFTVGATFVGGVTTGGFTVIVTSLNAVSNVSFAVSRSTYVPAWSNVAVVSGLEALAKVTTPGPLDLRPDARHRRAGRQPVVGDRHR